MLLYAHADMDVEILVIAIITIFKSVDTHTDNISVHSYDYYYNDIYIKYKKY